VKKILIVLLLGILCLSMSFAFSLKVAATSAPADIVYSVPITLTNTQSVATFAPYQQMISLDSSKYSSYEASNLQNVEFYTSTGSVIPSWLESGDSSSSSHTVYWLNLPNGIPAKSSVTIYLGFASTTTNLFNSQTTGEAPTLSSIYGQYDDGANVFLFYDNFAGRTLSSLWVDNTAQSTNTYTVNNGITVQSATSADNMAAVYSVNTFSQGITEFYGTIPKGDQTGTFTAVTVGLHGTSAWDSDIGAVEGSYGLVSCINLSVQKDETLPVPGLSFGADNIYSLMVPSADSALRMAQVNYGSKISGTANNPSLPQPIGFQNQENTGIPLGPIYWVRERVYPPNGVMPTVAINGQSSSSVESAIWVPSPVNSVAVVGAAVVLMGAVSFVFSAVSNPLGGFGGKISEKTKGVIPDNIKSWLEDFVSSKRKLHIDEKSGSPFVPTKPETLAYGVAVVVMALAFSYVKVSSLGQLVTVLPVILATSVLVAFVKKFFSIAFMRSRGVWSEHKIWPFGLGLFLVTTLAFRVPFSSPTRNVHSSSKFTERFGAILSASEILIGMLFAGFFFILMKSGFNLIGSTGLAMCVIGSFFGTLPIAPMSGKDIYDNSKIIWASLFLATLLMYALWLILL